MSILHNIILPILIPLSWLYNLIIWLRNIFYNIGLLKTVKFDVPIISVGNITMGGTGKTPMVIFLAKLITNHHRQPGIVSRGYKRNSKGLVMVHDGKELLTNAELYD